MEVVYRLDTEGWKSRAMPANAREARERLEAGNRTFAALCDADAELQTSVIPVHEAALGAPGVAPPQRPFAAVLGCADARAPVELVFQQAFNDIFVVRVAGNVLGAESLGSLAFAADHMAESLRIVCVLAHSSCGAVTAGVDAFLDANAYPTGVFGMPLRAIVDRVLLSIGESKAALERVAGRSVHSQPGYRAALIETAVAVNAGLTAMAVERELADRLPQELGIVFGVYDLGTHRVGIHGSSGENGAGLLEPPRDVAGLDWIAATVAGSSQVAALLEG
jgi:carbonic anhydrase